jgi:hypothetical protein
VASNPVSKLTEEQYLAIHRAAEVRSEFVDGEMFAMSGGTTVTAGYSGISLWNSLWRWRPAPASLLALIPG